MGKPSDPAYHWNGAELDLDDYLARIGFDGERAPTVATLRALVRGHTTSVPFENLEIVLGRPIELDLGTLQDKLVRHRRGGYCYEHVGLFAAALERLGFGVTGLTARVSMGAEVLQRATHALLRVTTGDDDRIWLCDVGFGSGPLEPIELSESTGEFTAGAWRFRLERRFGELSEDLWVLHQFGAQGWVDRHSFTLTPQYRVDYLVGNHFVSTSPRSPFTTRPFAQRFRPEVHHVLDDLTLTARHPDGTISTRELEPADLPGVLADVFDIELTAADAAALAAAPWPAARLRDLARTEVAATAR